MGGDDWNVCSCEGQGFIFRFDGNIDDLIRRFKKNKVEKLDDIYLMEYEEGRNAHITMFWGELSNCISMLLFGKYQMKLNDYRGKYEWVSNMDNEKERLNWIEEELTDMNINIVQQGKFKLLFSKIMRMNNIMTKYENDNNIKIHFFS